MTQQKLVQDTIIKNVLELKDISLNYGQFQALSNISLSIRHSEIHAIVGEHGAGKSSLGMIICGVLRPHRGTMLFEGQSYRSFPLKIARKLGIEMVQQHILSLNPYFSIADNFSLDSRPLYKRWRKKHALQAARTFFSQYAIDLDPATPVQKFSDPERLFIDILKHIYPHPRLLILDEALEKLTASHFHTTVTILQQLKQAGTSILLITHRIDDIYNLADRVSIIKNGEVLVTDDVSNIDKINLIKMAYTQIAEQNPDNLNQEFYQLLKYNEAILRNLPVNLIVTDNENTIKLVNDYCKQHFNLEQHSYLEAPLHHLLSSPNAETDELIEGASSFQEENTFYQIPITVNHIRTISNIKTFPIYDGTFLIGTIITIEDVTEYDQLQKQVMLSEKLASVGLLAAGVAHEINNPLEIIYTYLSYMKYKFRGPELHKMLDTLHEQISDIATIVSNLLSFSDNTANSEEDLDINDEIKNVLNLIEHSAEDKNITLQFTPFGQELLIRANKHEIKQVMLNLLKNSFEAMPTGGEIVIHTRRTVEADTRFAQIIFQDTGPGISHENPNNIFLPFYSTKQGEANNLGLGLSVSYGIIQKYNGTIIAENIESGCQFIITLPQAI